jgi:TrmH family RNA methyltransferase
VAFGLDAVVCLDGTVDPWAAKTVRASAGMVFRVPVVRATGGDVIERLEQARIPILVADARGNDVPKRRHVKGFALVVGNEGAGVREELLDAADARIAVPMPGPAESLNAATAGAILMYALTRGPGNG